MPSSIPSIHICNFSEIELPETDMSYAIDIETLSTRSNAAVLEIGIVPFSIPLATIYPLQAFRAVFSPHLYTSLALSEYFDIDSQTVSWWKDTDIERAKQYDEYLANGIEYPGLSQDRALDINEWLVDHKVNAAGTDIYAWGASFDFPILENFMHANIASGPSIYYKNKRCARTVWDFAVGKCANEDDWRIKELAAVKDMIPGKAHETIYDATVAAASVILAYAFTNEVSQDLYKMRSLRGI